MMKNKALGKFLASIGIGACVGACIGFAGIMGNSSLLEMTRAFKMAVLNHSLLLLNAVVLPFLAVAFVFSREAKKIYRQPNFGENEEAFDLADRLLSKAMILFNVLTIVIFLFLGLLIARIAFLPHYTTTLIGIAEALALLLAVVYGQGVCVKQIKVLYPEKKGNILESKFQKEWLESCDEAEKLGIFQASYKSFLMMQRVMPICWCAAVLAILFLEQGLLAMVLVTIIWGIQTGVYYKASMENLRQ